MAVNGETPGRKKPLILRAVSRMSIGGVQRGILATLTRADRERFDYAVLCTKKAGHWADQVRALDVALHVQKTLPPWDPYQIFRLSRVIRSIAPDLIHIHMAPMVLPVASAARLAGVRHLVIQHHNDYERHWDALGGLLRRWEFSLTRRANAIIGVSGAVAQCTENRVGLTSGRVEAIPNGLECEQFMNAEPIDPRPEWCVAADAPLVVQVSRWLPTKRIEDFIEAAAIVRGRWPDLRPGEPLPVFIVIGGGASDLEESYRRLIHEMKLEDGVLLAGSRPDIPSLLPCVQVGALASEMEGFGQVILEYIAAGLPVAATNLDCIAEMVSDEKEALLSPPRRPEALAANIERLLLDRDLARRLVNQGRRRLVRYTWENAVRGYERIYSRVLGLEGDQQPCATS